MQIKFPPLWSVLILGGAVCAGTVFYFANSRGAEQIISPSLDPDNIALAVASTTATTQISPVVTAAVAAQVGVPVELIIPAINIDTSVASAGLTANGAMAVPVGPTSTTWFDLGARPGEIGSAVIAGHEGWKDGIFAIFDNLHELQPGDKIYVVDDRGATTTFVVRMSQLFGQDASAATVFGSSDGVAHLNLITCEGTWNAAEKSYSNRLVVFADLAK